MTARWWATMSWSSRAIRARSRLTARRVSAACSSLELACALLQRVEQLLAGAQDAAGDPRPGGAQDEGHDAVARGGQRGEHRQRARQTGDRVRVAAAGVADRRDGEQQEAG